MKSTKAKQTVKLKEQYIKDSFDNAWNYITRVGVNFGDMKRAHSFSKEKRVLMLKRMIAYFEIKEQYERCAYLMKLLRFFKIKKFDTKSYR